MAEADNNDDRPECKYGLECYQTNKPHLTKYKHPARKYYEDILIEQKLKKNFAKGDTSMSKEVPKSPSPEVEAKAEESKTKVKGKRSPINDKQAKKKHRVAPVVESNKLLTPDKDARNFITKHFLVPMPYDFYLLWEFVNILKPSAPLDALHDVGLKLVGPYDVLAGRFNDKKFEPQEYHLHWRYYFDPPEFQTVIAGDRTSGFHLGYFRDTPESLPAFVASNNGKNGLFYKKGENIFAALRSYLQELKSGKTITPHMRMAASLLMRNLGTKAEASNLPLAAVTDKMKTRDANVCAKTFNKLGLNVPYNRKTKLGYRPLVLCDSDFEALMTRFLGAPASDNADLMSELQQVLTWVDIAMDECDFGTGLKLGWDLLFFGVESLNTVVSRYLKQTYTLLQRDAFAEIIEAHMNLRSQPYPIDLLEN